MKQNPHLDTTEKNEKVGTHEQRGTSRSSMEDKLVASPNFKVDVGDTGETIESFYSVYDGHGWNKASNYASTKLHINLKNELKENNSVQDAIEKAFQQNDTKFANKFPGDNSGTCAIVAVIGKKGETKTLYVANCGNCRAVASGRENNVIELSTDHVPSNTEEKKRIEAAGGKISSLSLEGPELVSCTKARDYTLKITRAIGDNSYKNDKKEKIIISEPEIREEPITKDLDFFILASNGIWRAVDNKPAVDFVQKKLKENVPLDRIAQDLAEEAVCKSSTDDIAIIIVKT
jgi:protein phosphatase 2C family protein 2/3